jgi:hypothetical protein
MAAFCGTLTTSEVPPECTVDTRVTYNTSCLTRICFHLTRPFTCPLSSCRWHVARICSSLTVLLVGSENQSTTCFRRGPASVLQEHCGLYSRDWEMRAGRVIFIKIKIALKSIISDDMDTPFPRNMICTTEFNFVTVLNSLSYKYKKN